MSDRKRPPAAKPHVPGEPGMWVFIFGDMMLFVVYFSNFLVARRGNAALFRQSQHALDQNYGAINTVVLLLSSLFVLLGLDAVRRGDRTAGPRLYLGAILCALAFIALKAAEWGGKFAHGITVGSGGFFQMYFILTGLHLAHVVLGIVVLLICRNAARRAEIGQGMFMFVEGGSAWWHMVDLIWMILFPLVYLAN